MNLSGVGSLVTGGSSGLGLATAMAMADKGARVVLFDLPSSEGNAQAVRIGRGASFVAGDVTSVEDVQRAIDSVDNFRVLVNCAGIGASLKILGRDGLHPIDAFRRVIEVNLVGTFNCLSRAASRMSEASELDGERGVVVNTASIAAFEGQVGQAAYASSKGGIVALTIVAARELASLCIRVCTIAPGIMDTPMLRRHPDQVRNALAESVPHPKRLGQPGEFAALALHIVDNAYLNGETIRLDGAIRMAPR
jgi:NAD(P)-dependent dehydrogenase (short-subunit alcohol dehydrogenase family)